MTDIQKLKVLAEALIAANEKYLDDECNHDLADAFTIADDALQDALPPETVLELIAEVDRSRNKWTAMAVLAGEACEQHDKLKAENEALRDGANFRAIQSLRADCEDLRKDADRYRWMRDIAPRLLVETPLIAMCAEDGSVRYRDHGSEMLLSGPDADAAVDAAMSKEASHG